MLCIVLLFFGFAVINPIFNKKTYKIYLLLFAVALACLAWFTKPDLYDGSIQSVWAA